MYIRDVQGGHCDPKADCTIEKETVATAVVNGNNGFGAVIGKYSMDLAIKKARDVGIGLVVAHCKFGEKSVFHSNSNSEFRRTNIIKKIIFNFLIMI